MLTLLETRTLALSPGTAPEIAGLVLHHAAIVLDATTTALEWSSNAVPLRLVP